MSWGLEDVRVSRGSDVALDGVTVLADPARVTVVVGGDGAGKTTCLQLLAGLFEPAAGVVRRPGKDRIGYVPATAGLYPDLTVAENLRLVVMADGKVVAAGTAEQIIGGRTVARVRCGDPNRTFALLDADGLAVQAHGDTLRVSGMAEKISGLLSGAGIDAAVETVPANLEEEFVTLVAHPAAG